MSVMSMFGGDSHGSSKRCRLSICLFLTCFILLSEVTAFSLDSFHHEGATFFSLLNPQSVVSAGQYVCQTEVCNSEANRMKEYMDLNSDPCSDFYQFTCGGFMEKYRHVPGTVDFISLTQQRIIEQVVGLMTDDEVPESFKKFQDFYKSCVDLDSDIRNVIPEMMEILEEVGGFPLLEGSSWDPDRFNILGSAPGQTLNPMKYLLFEFRVNTFYSENEERRNILTLSSPHVQLPSTALMEGLDSEIVNQTFNILVKFAEFLGVDSVEAKEAYLELLEYQTKLAEINYNCSYDPKIMTVQELSELAPSIPWLEYFRSILPDTVNIDVNEPIQLLHSSCLPEIVELIQNTPKRVIANYVGTMMTVGAMAALHSIGLQIPKFLTPDRYESEFVGVPRSQICAKHMIEIFDSFVGPVHAAKYFDEENNKQLREVLTSVKSAAQNILESSTFLDPETRNRLLDWSSNFTINVPTPAEIETPSERIQEMVAEVKISPNTFFRNIIEAGETYTRWMFTSMHFADKERHAVATGRWINNYWIYGWDKIDVAVGYQQAPLFDKNRPAYLNFGIMGSIFAKMLMANLYDITNWYGNPEVFQSNAQCLNDQQSPDIYMYRESLEKLGFAGPATIEAVSTAYSRWVEENAAEGALPELGLNKNQILWLAGGQTMCNKFEEGRWEEFPAATMLNSVVMNSERFAKDFSCASGSPMNPADKCVLW